MSILLPSHNTKITQYEHPVKTQFIQHQQQQERRVSDGGRPESQAIPAQNPLVPANPYISEGILIESLTNRITFYKTKISGFDRTLTHAILLFPTSTWEAWVLRSFLHMYIICESNYYLFHNIGLLCFVLTRNTWMAANLCKG